ncbi:pyridoxal phosphate-dependent aminotransferase [Vibrio sp. S9_S30]|uniref:pyridoxal phosphate-dependent aminotransferase n=1 Tax=Vibrio sp. S9_S30 TaxID=2720226 RepID=UPI0016811605|nr:pyridoxal phosphate-dependent aminotransferase [Vibrio sp. S9_S30]MBD1557132.1 pyridoxal phosphate-dependent aminotransferase [Vibrio sp. S9_S30]
MAIANYTIQEWLFNEAHGKFDYDLAESGVQFQYLKDLTLKGEWCLDYSVDRGDLALRNTVLSQYKNDPKGLSSLITHGAQEALYILYNSRLEQGDHVICTFPGWQQAWEVPKSKGCDVSLLEWTPGAAFPVEELIHTISDNTKLLILNSPCNPTGAVLTDSEWDQIVQVCEQKGIWIVNDEEYLLDFSQSVVNKYEKSVSISSLSKIYGLPALRLGWAVSQNDELIEAMVNYKRYTTVSNSMLLEKTALLVLEEKEKHLQRFYNYIDAGRPILDKFAELAAPHLTLIAPQNTPYAWFNTSPTIDSNELTQQLLAQHKLLVMPAEVFGSNHGVRITYARDKDFLKKCLNMILETLQVKQRL